MSKDKSAKKEKAERTPEEQAKRDAKKAAKKAVKAEAEAEPVVEAEKSAKEAEPETESIEVDGGSKSPTKKRKRHTNGEGAESDDDKLEIDITAPAPLSKAEIRAARKKAKKGETAVAPKRDYEKAAKGEKGAKDEEAGGVGGKRQNSVWIGNLAFKTTPETLKEYLEKGVAELGGKGESIVTRVNLPKKTGRGEFAENKGFAYVDFATPELQAFAVELSERPFEGRRLLIKKGDDHTALPTARTPKPLSSKAEDLGSSSKRPETSTIYMGNLPFDATEILLRDFVEANALEREGLEEEEGQADIGARGGKRSGLKKVRLAAFEDTGRCKGFAFLDFLSARHAKFVLANRKNHYYNGRRLKLEFASEEAAKRSGGRVKPDIRPQQPRNHYAKPSDPSDPSSIVDSGDYKQEAEAPAGDKRGKKWESSGRPRPGAALAMAKREQVGIVEAEGIKTTFD